MMAELCGGVNMHSLGGQGIPGTVPEQFPATKIDYVPVEDCSPQGLTTLDVFLQYIEQFICLFDVAAITASDAGTLIGWNGTQVGPLPNPDICDPIVVIDALVSDLSCLPSVKENPCISVAQLCDLAQQLEDVGLQPDLSCLTPIITDAEVQEFCDVATEFDSTPADLSCLPPVVTDDPLISPEICDAVEAIDETLLPDLSCLVTEPEPEPDPTLCEALDEIDDTLLPDLSCLPEAPDVP